jgi:hypothetical protein
LQSRETEEGRTWSCCLKTKMTARGSWLTNVPLCFCFSFPSSLISSLFFFALFYSSSVCVLWSLILSLFPLLYPLCTYSLVLLSLVFSVFSRWFFFLFFLCFFLFAPPPPLSVSLCILSVYSLLLRLCVRPSSFFFCHFL